MNRVINIGSEQKIKDGDVKTLDNEIVYSDIDMNAVLDFKQNLKIKKDVNIRAVQNSIDNIFSWNNGERIINPEFGSRLKTLLYEGINDYNLQAIFAEIKNALNKWEPRVNLIGVNNSSTMEDTENNTIVLDIEYTINGLPDKVYKKQYIYDKYAN